MIIYLQSTKILKPQSTPFSYIRYITNLTTLQATSVPSASSRRSNFVSNSIPSLEEFLFQQRVKQVYRTVLRQIYKHHERDDLIKFVRDEFKVNANERDLNHRKYLLSLGVSQIVSMSASLGLKIDL
ncbi:hypothetical protein KGF57_000403 [Candida theae]|uniref:Complex 1 LYR protein domain-containing protein n=1 Tax=Candida theae TaxID=1198502 RepID=A0AAD5BIW8_9ASCO|nr:uncharacterized protein KGF57_000403 [Candida theae]KAI5967375.1 hypothetical protein KGF57_000403 [Candida theae]